MKRAGVMGVAVLLVAACGSGSSPPSDGAADVPAADASGDTGNDADAPAADGGVACGSMTCPGDDLCVTVSTCGGALQCTAIPDGGCPTGTIQTPCPTGMAGCVPTCPPPTSSCKPRPAACGATITCGCVSALCGGPSCASALGRNVFCAYE